MVPDKFNMVDMEGIDILFSYGDAIPGLYQKLVESIAQCRYQCLYNWYFDGILIPPTYVEMTVIDNIVWIGEGVSINEEDTLELTASALKNVTGAIAHITDALARKPNRLVCYINPLQDLHGYDHPWPDGGMGNLFPLQDKTATSNGVTIVFTANHVKLTGTGTSSGGRLALNTANFALEAGTYYYKRFNVSSAPYPALYVQNGNTIVSPINDGIFTLSEDSNAINIGMNVESGVTYNIEFDIMLVAGSNEPSAFYPYSNICPISGWTGLEVYHEAVYDPEADPIITDNWQSQVGTVYGGMRDMASGKLTVTEGDIASYNGEVLPSTWISDRDTYSEGASPTIGAQVVYKLAEPLIYNLTPPPVFNLFQGENNIWHDANGDTSVTYWYNKI